VSVDNIFSYIDRMRQKINVRYPYVTINYQTNKLIGNNLERNLIYIYIINLY